MPRKNIRNLFRLGLATILSGGALLAAFQTAYAAARLQIELSDCNTGAGISGASINVTTAKKGSKAKATTSAKGFAELYPVLPENTTHTIAISAEGYNDALFYADVGKNTSLKLELCLWSKTPAATSAPTAAPTSPPMPTPVFTPMVTAPGVLTQTLPLSPTLSSPSPPAPKRSPAECGGLGRCAGANLPSGDQVAQGAAKQCLSLLTDTLVSVVPLEQVGQLEPAIAQANELLAQCQGKASCVMHNALVEGFSQVVDAIPTSAAAALPPDFMAIPIYNLITSPEGQQSCATIGPVYWEAARILSQKLQRIDMVALYGPGSVLVADSQGNQSGFRPDGSAAVDIAGSISGAVAGSQFVLLPGGRLAGLQIQASEAGLITLDVLHSPTGAVQDSSFQNVAVAAQSAAEMTPGEAQPLMTLDAAPVNPTLFETYPIAASQPEPDTPPTQEPGAPIAEPTQASPELPFSLDDIPSVLTAVLVCIVSLAIGILALILLLTRFKRSNDSEEEQT
ncbi:MAG: carboxypeptidase regulatory-like domain-containing protein [Anaerolineales bacterium]|nr:carboxypeptidase regulatory-like domain-containing protein [Anaerolineales bacterium]